MEKVDLNNIKSNIEKCVKVISDLLNVDVDIINADSVRVSGTGTYLYSFYQIGKVFQYVIKNKTTVYINNPGKNEICTDCANKNKCCDLVELACPIVLDDEVLGVISITSHQPELKELLDANTAKYIDFFENIADLIATKYREYINHYQEKLMLDILNKMINLIAKGVIIFDNQNKIEYMNKTAEIILGNNLSQLRYLHRINNFSIMPHSRTLNDNSAEYTIRIFDKKIKLIGDIFIIKNEINKINRAFVFEDVATAQRNLTSVMISSDNYPEQFLKGNNAEFVKAREMCEMYSTLDTNALLLGEVGVGTEVFARMMHNRSKRSGKPFQRVSCYGAVDFMLEHELFGFDNGLQSNGYLSKIELASFGTLFIDEIGLMSMYLQQRLYHTLTDPECNIKLIASSTKPLHHMMLNGEFFDKLYYLLEPYIINIPPLRSRREDITSLTQYLIELMNCHSNKNVSLSNKVLKAFCEYTWPGNIRELENTLEIINNASQPNSILNITDLPLFIQSKLLQKGNDYNLKMVEKNTIRKALNDFSKIPGAKKRAASELGISKMTLYRKMKEYQLTNDNGLPDTD